MATILSLLGCLAIAAGTARASIGVFVGEPFGSFGTMLPTGHTSLYLDHICVASPTTFRPCRPGEFGAVLSRYHDLRPSTLDWYATPVLPFLYGVEDLADVPAFVTPQTVLDVRERYRRDHLQAFLPVSLDPGQIQGRKQSGEWGEGVGSAFDRRLFLYEIDTTPAQDAELLVWLNGLSDRRRYSLLHANCANFAADAVNLLYPQAIRLNKVGDFGMLSPKQVARSFDTFGDAHPELHLRVYEIPQLPGTLRRSRPLRGAAETFVKTKRYLATLIVIQPEAIAADWLVYEKADKWTVGNDATELHPEDWRALATYRIADRGAAPVVISPRSDPNSADIVASEADESRPSR